MIESLFRPLHIGELAIPNRIAMAPMTRNFSPGGVPGPDVAAYYQRRAHGGVGLIITEGMAVNAVGAHTETIPLLYQSETVEACRGIVAAVHSAGGLIIPQLWHVGVQPTLRTDLGTEGAHLRRVGPSGLLGSGDPGGHTLTDTEIADTILDFAKAARAAQDVGFDGIEIHGAHGYLLDQFFWERTNKREDTFGGGARQRARFAAEVVRACRAEVRTAFPIIFRFSQWKMTDYGAQIATTPNELGAILAPLVEAGVSAFHCSTRRFSKNAFAPDPTTLAGWTKRLTGIPVIAVGAVTLEGGENASSEADSEHAERVEFRDDVEKIAELIEAEEFDMIALGRTLIANPDWVLKVQAGMKSELVPFTRKMLSELI